MRPVFTILTSNFYPYRPYNKGLKNSPPIYIIYSAQRTKLYPMPPCSARAEYTAHRTSVGQDLIRFVNVVGVMLVIFNAIPQDCEILRGALIAVEDIPRPLK